MPFEPGHPRDPIQYGKYLVGAVEFTPGYATILEFKTHPVMLPVWIGCGVVMLGIFLCFYCNHQRVWVLVRPREGGSEIFMAGDSFKWREGFMDRFEAVVSQCRSGS